MIARHIIVLLLALAVSACTPQSALLASLIPDGTAGVVLGKLEKVQDKNSKRIAELEAAGKWDELARFAAENIDKDRANADWWFVLGYARVQLRQYNEAINAFGTATRLEPDNIVAWNYLGQSYRAAGDPRRAVNALNSALNMARESPVTLYLLGESYGDLQRYDDAVVAYREAVAIEPEFPAAWFSLARTYARLGRNDDAQAARVRLQKLDP